MSFAHLLAYQLSLAMQHKMDWLSPLLFFCLVMLLFPLALGALPQTLSSVAPGLVWVTALLATMLSLESLFREDFEDGTLELFLASRGSLIDYTLAKLLVHWVFYALPLVLISPLLAYSLHLPFAAYGVLMTSLFLGTLALVGLGAIGVAVTSGLKYNSFLLALLVLPFYVPILVFGASAVEAAAQGWSALGPLYMLAAFALLTALLAPWAIAKALTLSLNG